MVEEEKKYTIPFAGLTMVRGCGFGSRCGAPGILSKLEKFTIQEAVAGEAVRNCDWGVEDDVKARFQLTVEEDGYLGARCVTPKCRDNVEW